MAEPVILAEPIGREGSPIHPSSRPAQDGTVSEAPFRRAKRLTYQTTRRD
jgi:hypothetical protein